MFDEPGPLSAIAWSRGAMLMHFELHGFVPLKSPSEVTVAVGHEHDLERTVMVYRRDNARSAVLRRSANWVPHPWGDFTDAELRRALSLLYRRDFIPGVAYADAV